MVGTDTKFDTVLDVCEHPHRRIVLATLAETYQSVPVNDFANVIGKYNHDGPVVAVSDETLTRIRTDLRHVHLPKLDEAGLVEYGSEHQLVEPTAQFESRESQLMAVLDADPNLHCRSTSNLGQKTKASHHQPYTMQSTPHAPRHLYPSSIVDASSPPVVAHGPSEVT
jgi:DNA-binding transcriptional ArsR family regulator